LTALTQQTELKSANLHKKWQFAGVL